MQLRSKTSAALVSATLAAALVGVGLPASGAAAAPATGTATGNAATRTVLAGRAPITVHPDSGTREADSGLTAIQSTAAAGNYTVIDIYYQGDWAGMAVWSENPSDADFDGNGSPDPGDAILAYDGLADGYGIEARLSTGRVASTRGHSSPYSSGWKTGDLPENHSYEMRGCLVKGSAEQCWSVTVHS